MRSGQECPWAYIPYGPRPLGERYLPEPLEELDPDLHAGEIEDAPATPEELDAPVRPDVSLAVRS